MCWWNHLLKSTCCFNVHCCQQIYIVWWNVPLRFAPKLATRKKPPRQSLQSPVELEPNQELEPRSVLIVMVWPKHLEFRMAKQANHLIIYSNGFKWGMFHVRNQANYGNQRPEKKTFQLIITLQEAFDKTGELRSVHLVLKKDGLILSRDRNGELYCIIYTYIYIYIYVYTVINYNYVWSHTRFILIRLGNRGDLHQR